MYVVTGYCYTIHNDIAVVQSFLSCLADNHFWWVKILELENSTLYFSSSSSKIFSLLHSKDF